MTVKVKCPNCGKVYRVSDESLGRTSRCKSCGKQFSLTRAAQNTVHSQTSIQTEHSSRTADRTAASKTLGRFEIRSRLGAGAFGTVYRAWDPTLDREIALKVPHAGLLADEENKQRYLREPKAAGRLRHPNIVPVFEAGFECEALYIASAFIEGRTLEEKIRDTSTVDFRAAGAVIIQLAEALDYAHGKQVVHRDIKPANIMIDSDGDALILDFGLARIQEAADRMSQDGTVLGTPAYMPPEQARGALDEIGPSSDQYSLGVVLYEMLTGERPFNGPPELVISLVINQEPERPGSHNPKIPRDLETICLKAMAKDSDKRYATCRDFAEDIRRWMNNEPIRARRVSLVERSIRWIRRHPGISIASSLVVLVASIAAGVTLWQRGLIDDALLAQSQAELDAESERYVKDLELAANAIQAGDHTQVREILQSYGEESPVTTRRGWEWYLLCGSDVGIQSRFELPPLWAGRLSWSASDEHLLTAATVANMQTGELSPIKKAFRRVMAPGMRSVNNVSASFAPGRKILAVRDANSVSIFDSESLTQIVELKGLQPADQLNIEFSHDGQFLATTGGVWKVTSDDPPELIPIAGLTPAGSGLAWNPVTKSLAFNSANQRVVIGKVEPFSEVTQLDHAGESVSWNATGKFVAVAGKRKSPASVLVYPADGSHVAAALEGPAESAAVDAQWHPQDEERIATLHIEKPKSRRHPSDSVIRIWNTTTRRLIRSYKLGPASSNVAWNNAGDTIACLIREDSKTRLKLLWSGNGLPAIVMNKDRARSGPVKRISWSPVGNRLMLSTDRDVSVHDVTTGRLIGRVEQSGFGSPIDMRAAWNPIDHSVWMIKKGGAFTSLPRDAFGDSVRVINGVGPLLWSYDGRYLVVGARVFESPRNHMEVGNPRGGIHETPGSPVAWSPNGRMLASFNGSDINVSVIPNAGDGSVVSHRVELPESASDGLNAAAWSPAGNALLVGSTSGTLYVWDVKEQSISKRLSLHSSPITAVDWSPDGRRAVTSAAGGAVEIWDAEGWIPLIELYRHTSDMSVLKWSRDGRMLAAASADGTARVWDAGAEFLTQRLSPTKDRDEGDSDSRSKSDAVLEAERVVVNRVLDLGGFVVVAPNQRRPMIIRKALEIPAHTDFKIINIDLRASEAGDSDLEAISRLSHISGLTLDNTSITDEGLAHVSSMTTLDMLKLNGTAVTDAGLSHLESLKLSRLEVRNTGVTSKGVLRIKETMPECRITNSGGGGGGGP